MSRQLQMFENKSGKLLEVYVEMYPDQYILKPDDVMTIEYNHSGEPDDYGLHTIIHPDGFLQIYLDEFDSAVVKINGQVAEPWQKVTN